MSGLFKDDRTLSPVFTWGVRIVAGVLTIACLAYGMFIAIDSPSILGVNSKTHGLVVICLGLLTGRYASSGKTGLPALDEAMQPRDDDR